MLSYMISDPLILSLQILVGTDSHTCTAGAFGQFATGIGNTDAGFVLGTGKLLLKVCKFISIVQFLTEFIIKYKTFVYYFLHGHI